MTLHFTDNPALTIAIALAAGMVAQSLARHMRLPGIVLLLAAGVALGQDGLGVVEPDSLGESMHTLVGFAVAVILFEGGLHLNLKQIRESRGAIQRLITVGALVTAACGTAIGMFVLGWDWRLSLLFGSLVIVTGPTVVTPLLRRLRVQRTVAAILEAEGVLIDSVGAIAAAVALEVVLRPSGENMALALPQLAARIGVGAVIGALAGGLLVLLLRRRGVVPEGMQNVLTLTFALLVFQLANAVAEESGVAAVTAAGVVVGNFRSYASRELADFKEQLTTLFIGMLFVLLAADVRIEEVTALGWRGAVAVLLLIVLVRPLTVLSSTISAELSWRERGFLAYMGPRGIVAAAVASLFDYELARAHIPGGTELRAMVFLVIAATVLVSGLTGGPIATLLGVRQKSDRGYVLVGGNTLSRLLAVLLAHPSKEVLVLDRNAQNIRDFQAAGVEAIEGDVLREETLAQAELPSRTGAASITSNEDVNLLFFQKGWPVAKGIRWLVGITSWSRGVTPEMVEELGAEVLFGGVIDVPTWCAWIEHGEAYVEWWRYDGGVGGGPDARTRSERHPPYLALVHRGRDGTPAPVSSKSRFRLGDEVAFLIRDEARERAARRLEEAGFWQVTVPRDSLPTPEPMPKTPGAPKAVPGYSGIDEELDEEE